MSTINNISTLEANRLLFVLSAKPIQHTTRDRLQSCKLCGCKEALVASICPLNSTAHCGRSANKGLWMKKKKTLKELIDLILLLNHLAS
jgi:hypothetical protein